MTRTNMSVGGKGDMKKETYDADADGIVDKLPVAKLEEIIKRNTIENISGKVASGVPFDVAEQVSNTGTGWENPWTVSDYTLQAADASPAAVAPRGLMKVTISMDLNVPNGSGSTAYCAYQINDGAIIQFGSHAGVGGGGPLVNYTKDLYLKPGDKVDFFLKSSAAGGYAQGDDRKIEVKRIELFGDMTDFNAEVTGTIGIPRTISVMAAGLTASQTVYQQNNAIIEGEPLPLKPEKINVTGNLTSIEANGATTIVMEVFSD